MLSFSILGFLSDETNSKQPQKSLAYNNIGLIKSKGVLPNKEVEGGGGLGPRIKFGGKIWGNCNVRPSSPNKRKNLGSSAQGEHLDIRYMGMSIRYFWVKSFWQCLIFLGQGILIQ